MALLHSSSKDRPIYKSWTMDWIEEIRYLYHLNKLRITQQLKNAAKSFKKKADSQLKNEQLAKPYRKALKSLKRHWKGLTTFIQYPEVSMDNNAAERELRGCRIRKKKLLWITLDRKC